MLIPLNNSQPLHRQIYEKLRDKVLSGELRACYKLPATRELARDLGVSRTTVLLAYDQLISEGYLYTISGSGTYVSKLSQKTRTPDSYSRKKAHKARLSDTGNIVSQQFGAMFNAITKNKSLSFQYDFSMGSVQMDRRSNQIWRRLLNISTKEFSKDLRDPQGYYPLRQAIADHLQRTRNCICSAENIVITNGSQQAFDLLGRILLNPGDMAVMEDPCYFGAKLAFSSCQAKIAYIDVDKEGIKTDELKKLQGGAKLICITPSHQFPTGSIMSLSRRMALVEWAKANNTCIIEDDYDSEFRYDGKLVEAIQGIDHYDHTVYVGTFSKVLSPALRAGYVVLPESLVTPFVALRWIADVESHPIQQRALALWMTEGCHHQHLRRMRRVYSKRRDLLLYSLEKYFSGNDIKIEGSNTGLHILLWLNQVEASCAEELSDKLHKNSVAAQLVGDFYNKPLKQCGISLGFGHIKAEDIEQGIKTFQHTVMQFCSQ